MWINYLFCLCGLVSVPTGASFLYQLSSVASQQPGGLSSLTETTSCSLIPGLSPEQRNLCQREPGILQAVLLGTQVALKECERQFRWERWNCSTNAMNYFEKTIQRVYRETAFVYGITSAGIMHSIARACGLGNLTICSCGDPAPPPEMERQMLEAAGVLPNNTGNPPNSPQQGVSTAAIPMFKWAGCSDNVDFGLRFGHYFVDRSEDEAAIDRAEEHLHKVKLMHKKRGGGGGGQWQGNYLSRTSSSQSSVLMTPHQWRRWKRFYRRERLRRRVNRHNNMVGRQLIAQNMRVSCRCHGVSGSCSLKSCWRMMPHFSQVGVMLKSRYQDAQKMRRKWRKQLLHQRQQTARRSGDTWNDAENEEKYPTERRQVRQARNSAYPPVDSPSTETLLFLRPSPNFCYPDPEKGVLGTVGRQCHKNTGGTDDCYVICCGRGFISRTVKKVSQCRCKFVWCCEVVCEECVHQEEEHYCQ